MQPVERHCVNLSADGAACERVIGTPSQSDSGADPGENASKPKGPGHGWDVMGRRGVWVHSTTETEKLRTLKDSAPQKQKKKKRVEEEGSFQLIERRLRQIGIYAVIGSVLFLLVIVSLGHQCFLALKYRNYLSAGLQALADGRNDRAEIEFGLCISADPKASDPYYYRGLAELKCGSNGSAMQDYTQAIDLDPTNLKAYLARATLLVKMKRYDDAIADCETVLAWDPNYFEAYRVRANAYSREQRFPAAIADLNKFLDHHQDKDVHRADALAKRAFYSDQSHDYQGAISDYTNAIICTPANGSLYASRAIVYMHARAWKKGLDDANQAIALNYTNPSVYKVRGVCNAQLDQDDDSLVDLDKLVRLHPTVDTHRIRGDQRFVTHDYLGTLEDFDYVLQAEPDDRAANMTYQKAKTALQKKAPRTSAIADAELRAPMPRPADLRKSPRDLLKKGYQLLLSGDCQPALSYLIAAVRANPNDPSARRYLAISCADNGLYSDAVAQLDVLARMSTLLPSDKLCYADSLVMCKRPKEAILIYNDLVASNPKNARARANLIKTLADNAIGDNTQTVATAPAGAPAVATGANVAVAQGANVAVAQGANVAVARHPVSPHAIAAVRTAPAKSTKSADVDAMHFVIRQPASM